MLSWGKESSGRKATDIRFWRDKMAGINTPFEEGKEHEIKSAERFEGLKSI